MLDKKIIDLTHTLNSDIPSWDGNSCFNTDIVLDYKDCTEPNVFRVQKMSAKAGAGTHIDAPAHCFPGGKSVAELSLESLSVDCVVIDVSDKADENYLAMPEAVVRFEEKHGRVPENAFVIFYTGWDKYWNTPEEYRNKLRFPAIHESTAKMLLERAISGIGIDTLSPDAIGDDFPVHRTILGAGKYIVENVANAALLPVIGAKVVIAPMKIEGGTEAPVRLVAFV